MRSVYLEMAIQMGKMGNEALWQTRRHSRQFLRGVTDFDEDGNYAWKCGAFASNSYRFSEMANPHRDLKDYSRVLHGEHIIPLKMVFERWLEMITKNSSEKDQYDFLDEHLEVIWITVEEQQLLDRKLGLRTKMPDDWNWGDDPLARLHFAGIIVIE